MLDTEDVVSPVPETPESPSEAVVVRKRLFDYDLEDLEDAVGPKRTMSEAGPKSEDAVVPKKTEDENPSVIGPQDNYPLTINALIEFSQDKDADPETVHEKAVKTLLGQAMEDKDTHAYMTNELRPLLEHLPVNIQRAWLLDEINNIKEANEGRYETEEKRSLYDCNYYRYWDPETLRVYDCELQELLGQTETA